MGTLFAPFNLISAGNPLDVAAGITKSAFADPQLAIRTDRHVNDPTQRPGIMTVPLKGSGYSSRIVCTQCRFTDCRPVTR